MSAIITYIDPKYKQNRKERLEGNTIQHEKERVRRVLRNWEEQKIKIINQIIEDRLVNTNCNEKEAEEEYERILNALKEYQDWLINYSLFENLPES